MHKGDKKCQNLMERALLEKGRKLEECRASAKEPSRKDGAWDLAGEEAAAAAEGAKVPRPQMRRRVRGSPGAAYFKPAGIPLKDLEETALTLAEFEALRLFDYQGFSQDEACKRMEVSQSTLSRTLAAARKKLAEAVVDGKAIRIGDDS